MDEACAFEGRREWYILRSINARLRYFPDFAKAAGTSCVRDCQGARAYMQAYDHYSQTHPSFDELMPLYDDE
jgi:hypothetical protein